MPMHDLPPDTPPGDVLLGYRRPRAGTQPAYLHAPYASTALRAPTRAPIAMAVTLSEVTGPRPSQITLGAHAADLTAGFAGEPLGERIIVSGRVLDENGAPVRNSVVEVWQCNAAGRYQHEGDRHDAPLDPNFRGTGQVLTDAHGRYAFKTIKPGAYPWRNHYNAWRPAHIHFSLHGDGIGQRLITQMYFPGDPLLAHDPIYNCVDDPLARERMVSSFDWEHAVSEYALAYRFDIVLRGRKQTVWE
ncbi:protocatechuate 3,4-dioxygenase subunit beta [Xanthomonas campestris pv. raphani]|uniref:protocatechuate 3,4-dioxygenase subunit beta n=1 Tax=Xanthomonas campestris TaxID=339 RepID=UPI002B22432C|nr:protocatechuate 3,4-dioxygenase subunit beta [Xanthomonas campestris]MEA9826695.1 protocatechuate 3,4-dioxygenase subunit beta [Xanthomonas campestris pv. raphani]